jgi:2-succinyl-5-enolpyruvyl-6-hydroxy-3-cyclohexene-1-carboxylate synthase
VSVIDERAAGFMALGMAKASGRPVAVTCTSGTAAANLAPAVHEASQARVPLIVLTGDRPPELREVGAGQAIDQVKLYGAAVRWFAEVGSHEPSRATAVHHRQLGCRAYFTAAGDRPGPVHLNFPLRDPLAPSPEELEAADWAGRPDGRPWTELRSHSPAPHADDVHALAARMAVAPRGVIVAGATAEDLAEPVSHLAAATGWPVLADATSGVRCGDHDLSHVVAAYDVLLRGEGFPTADLVVRVGDMPTSKPLRTWLADAPQVLLDPHAAWHEPTRAAELILHGAAGPACDALAAALEMLSAERDRAWLASWRDADARVAPALSAAPDPFEPKCWAALEGTLKDGAIAWVSSSMPIRDVEAFFPSSPKAIRFLSNRGANGIDGVISSAAGAARATGAPVTVLTGELALLHDIGGLLAAARAGIPLTVVCANNGGGGIFDFLPVAGAADPAVYEEHIATPSGLDLAAVAALAGMEHRVASTADEVAAAAATGPGLVEFGTDRAESVEMHREVVERATV